MDEKSLTPTTLVVKPLCAKSPHDATTAKATCCRVGRQLVERPRVRLRETVRGQVACSLIWEYNNIEENVCMQDSHQ